MRRFRDHPRVAALAGLLAVALAVLGAAAARSRTGPGCEGAPPAPELPAQLRALGDFAQPYPAGDLRGLDDVAERAATALHPDLAEYRARAGSPVFVRAATPARHDARIVELVGPRSPTGAPYVEAVVAFLSDCAGQLYLRGVADLGRGGTPPSAFPSLSRAVAADRLEAAAAELELVHTGDPLSPRWRDPRSGRSIGANATPDGLSPTSPPSG